MKAALLLDDGSTIGLGEVDPANRATSPITLPRECTIVGAIFWPDGTEEGVVTDLAPETVRAGDTYALREITLT